MSLARVGWIVLAGCGAAGSAAPSNHAQPTERESQITGTWIMRTHVSSPQGGTESVVTHTITLTPGHMVEVREGAKRKLGHSLPWTADPIQRSERPIDFTASGVALELDDNQLLCAPATIGVATPHALRVTDGESSPGVWSPGAEVQMPVLECSRPGCEDQGWPCHTDLARSPGIELGCVSLAGCGYRQMTSAAIVPLMACSSEWSDC